MFSKVLVLALFAAVALGASVPVTQHEVKILSQDLDIDPEGRFHFNYESEDGSKVSQEGDVKVVDKDTVVSVQHGQFSYQGVDGKTYTVSWTADENGFQAQGEHLPQVPEAIARSVEYLRAHPQKESHH